MLFIISLFLVLISVVLILVAATLFVRIVTALIMLVAVGSLIYYYESLIRSKKDRINRNKIEAEKQMEELTRQLANKEAELDKVRMQDKVFDRLPSLDFKWSVDKKLEALRIFFSKDLLNKKYDNYNYFFNELKSALYQVDMLPLFEKTIDEFVEEVEKAKMELPLSQERTRYFAIRMMSIALTAMDFIMNARSASHDVSRRPVNIQRVALDISDEDIRRRTERISMNVDETPALQRVINNVLNNLEICDESLTLGNYRFTKTNN